MKFIDELEGLAQVRRTGQEMAIRRGQSSKFNSIIQFNAIVNLFF
jgi:hypothetical protein